MTVLCDTWGKESETEPLLAERMALVIAAAIERRHDGFIFDVLAMRQIMARATIAAA